MDSAIITVLGGGSVNWMPGLMKDIYLINVLQSGEIRLVDPKAIRRTARLGGLTLPASCRHP